MSNVLVLGANGLVGSALCRALRKAGRNFTQWTRDDADLESQSAVFDRLRNESPSSVILAAARVGGIVANSNFPADFIRSNLAIQCNVIEGAYRAEIPRLLFLGSSCVYPKFSRQPITEDELLAGPLEPTNSAYAVAKIAGIEMCRAYNRQYGTDFISVMPTNLYGPGDNFDLQNSHVLPAMIRRFHEALQAGAETVLLWGSGAPRREFLHVDDMADACLALLDRHHGNEIVNIGCGEDVAIRELADLVARVVCYKGTIEWDSSKPDGTPRKLLDVSRLSAYGWRPSIGLEEGVRSTYEWFLAHSNTIRSE